MALIEFSLVILILLIRNALSMCSTCHFMLRRLSIWTPKNFADSVTFKGCTYIEIDVSLITFLCEKLMRWVFPVFSIILHLLHQLKIWFRYFCNLRLILQIPGTCAQIAMSSAKEDLPVRQRGWRMSLTYKINRIVERGLRWEMQWMRWLGQLVGR